MFNLSVELDEAWLRTKYPWSDLDRLADALRARGLTVHRADPLLLLSDSRAEVVVSPVGFFMPSLTAVFTEDALARATEMVRTVIEIREKAAEGATGSEG